MSTPSSTHPHSSAANGPPPQSVGSALTSLLARATGAVRGGGSGAPDEDESVSSGGGNSFSSTVDDDDGDMGGAAGELVLFVQVFVDDVRLHFVCVNGVPGGLLSSQRGEDRSRQGRGLTSSSQRQGVHRFFGAPMGSAELRVVYDGGHYEGGVVPRHSWATPQMTSSWISMGRDTFVDRWSRVQWGHQLHRRWEVRQWIRAFTQQRRRRRGGHIRGWAGAEVMHQLFVFTDNSTYEGHDIILRNQPHIQGWAGAEVVQQQDIILRNQPTDYFAMVSNLLQQVVEAVANYLGWWPREERRMRRSRVRE